MSDLIEALLDLTNVQLDIYELLKLLLAILVKYLGTLLGI